MLQNLVPLLLRPLRLLLPADSLRATRIMLLKATHAPLVAMILGWETWRLYSKDRHKPKSSLTPSNRVSKAPASLRRPLTPLPFAAGTRQAPLDEQTRSSVARPTQTLSASNKALLELQGAVATLRNQVDAMSSVIANELKTLSQAEEADC